MIKAHKKVRQICAIAKDIVNGVDSLNFDENTGISCTIIPRGDGKARALPVAKRDDLQGYIETN